MAKNVIAVCFDFDDTLTDDSTSALLAKHGIKPNEFWKHDVDALVRNEGWEPPNAWLHLLLKFMAEGRIPPMSNHDLCEFGKTLVPYEGLQELLAELRAIAADAWCEVEYYIISGGIQDIVEGFALRPAFKAIWACRLGSEAPGGPVKYVKRTISFTEKTRYLFMINKGISAEEASKNPTLVNEDILPAQRRVPFENIFYLGDGLTDVPCFSLLQKLAPGRRNTFGVFKAGENESAKKAWEKLIFPMRATGGTYNAKYSKEHSLGSVLRAAFSARCLEIKSQLMR